MQFTLVLATSCLNFMILEPSVLPLSILPDFHPDLPKVLIVDQMTDSFRLGRTYPGPASLIYLKILLWLLQLSESFLEQSQSRLLLIYCDLENFKMPCSGLA